MESHALSLFLRGVKDPDFERTVEIQDNKGDNTPMKSVIAIRKQYRGVMKKGSTERKSRNKMRRFCEEDDCYLDEDCHFKRARRQGDKDENLVLKSDHIIFKVKFLHVLQRIWR